jgi:hypothetical protein
MITLKQLEDSPILKLTYRGLPHVCGKFQETAFVKGSNVYGEYRMKSFQITETKLASIYCPPEFTGENYVYRCSNGEIVYFLGMRNVLDCEFYMHILCSETEKGKELHLALYEVGEHSFDRYWHSLCEGECGEWCGLPEFMPLVEDCMRMFAEFFFENIA